MECISSNIYNKKIRYDYYFETNHNLIYNLVELNSELDYSRVYDKYYVVYDLKIDDKYYLELEYYPFENMNEQCLLRQMKVFKNNLDGQCFIFEYNNIQGVNIRERCKAVYLYIGKNQGYERYDANYINEHYKFIDCFGNENNNTINVSFFHDIAKRCEELSNAEYIGKEKIKSKRNCNYLKSCV